MGRRSRHSPGPNATYGSCSDCDQRSAFCEACLAHAGLPLLETLPIFSASPEAEGFGHFPAIYLQTTAARWERDGARTLERLRKARVGPVVHILNGTAIDETHRKQLARKTGSSKHKLAVSWVHVAVATHALAAGLRAVLIVEDDARFVANASASVDAIMRRLAAEPWTCLRLGYSYRWARTCHYNASEGVAAVPAPKDVRSSVAVGYQGRGLETLAATRFYNFYDPQKMGIDTQLGTMFDEYLALPPLAAQASKISHLSTAYALFALCNNISGRRPTPNQDKSARASVLRVLGHGFLDRSRWASWE